MGIVRCMKERMYEMDVRCMKGKKEKTNKAKRSYGNILLRKKVKGS